MVRSAPLRSTTQPAWALALGLTALAGCHQTYDLSDPKQQLAAGKRYVADLRCAECHQSADPGDGILSGQTTARPGTTAYGANLTPDVATGLGGWADVEIVRALRFGVDDRQLPLCPTMPHYFGDGGAPAIDDGAAAAIVAYLRSLPAVSRAIPESMCPPIKPLAPADMATSPPDGGADAGVPDMAPADMAVPDMAAIDMASADMLADGGA